MDERRGWYCWIAGSMRPPLSSSASLIEQLEQYIAAAIVTAIVHFFGTTLLILCLSLVRVANILITFIIIAVNVVFVTTRLIPGS